MPPRSAFTGSFAATDPSHEVVCPLRNQDGTNCRKRCLGEKRYRSMQEHIRRAHPEHYLPKLPATEESFQLMINTPPSERPPPAPAPAQPNRGPTYSNSSHAYDQTDRAAPVRRTNGPPRSVEESYPAAATAAVALAQLHNHRPDSDMDSDTEYGGLTMSRHRMRPSIELPPLHDHINHHGLPPYHSSRPRELLPSVMGHSPSERSSTLPPIQRFDLYRRDKDRPSKTSISHGSRKPKHEKSRSKDYSRRMSLEGRKASSAEPFSAHEAYIRGKRWEDLIEAATSATEADSDRDLTPIPQSPASLKRSSMPPYTSIPPTLSYKASPLNRTLTPPSSQLLNGPSPFQTSNLSGETATSARSPLNSARGKGFHLSGSSDKGTSPAYYHHSPSAMNHINHTKSYHDDGQNEPTAMVKQPSSEIPSTNGLGGKVQSVHVFCANCHRSSNLRDSYACTECISGFCSDCVYSLRNKFLSSAAQDRPAGDDDHGRPCPRCGIAGAKYKALQLDVRLS